MLMLTLRQEARRDCRQAEAARRGSRGSPCCSESRSRRSPARRACYSSRRTTHGTPSQSRSTPWCRAQLERAPGCQGGCSKGGRGEGGCSEGGWCGRGRATQGRNYASSQAWWLCASPRAPGSCRCRCWTGYLCGERCYWYYRALCSSSSSRGRFSTV